MKITDIKAREILDSRGIPTVEVDVISGGYMGRASVPSGASTGRFEAVELRDRDTKRYNGRGVKIAIDNICNSLKPTLLGMNIFDQNHIDLTMKTIDGTKNKSQLGANAILAVSLAVARCASICLNIPLFRYLGGIYPKTIPNLFINVINGGAHADNTVSVQEFMIVPHAPFPDSLRIGAEIFYRLRKCLMEQNYNTNVGDEGGFAPSFSSTAEALDILVHAIERAGYIPGKDVSLALDVAASEFFENNVYTYENRQMTSEDMIKIYEKLIEDYPIISIEDPLDEEDWKGFASLTKRIGGKVKIVGDDLFVTQSKRLLKGIDTQTANSILIKPNQVGTLTETLETIQLAQKNGYDVIVSHRSGETEDTFIADLAVAVQAHSIKTGSLSRTDRLAKYNQLTRIYEML